MPCRYLVDALKGFIAHAAVSKEFLGLIVLPLASNATDHSSAVILAAKGKMNLALGWVPSLHEMTILTPLTCALRSQLACCHHDILSFDLCQSRRLSCHC